MASDGKFSSRHSLPVPGDGQDEPSDDQTQARSITDPSAENWGDIIQTLILSDLDDRLVGKGSLSGRPAAGTDAPRYYLVDDGGEASDEPYLTYNDDTEWHDTSLAAFAREAIVHDAFDLSSTGGEVFKLAELRGENARLRFTLYGAHDPATSKTRVIEGVIRKRGDTGDLDYWTFHDEGGEPGTEVNLLLTETTNDADGDTNNDAYLYAKANGDSAARLVITGVAEGYTRDVTAGLAEADIVGTEQTRTDGTGQGTIEAGAVTVGGHDVALQGAVDIRDYGAVAGDNSASVQSANVTAIQDAVDNEHAVYVPPVGKFHIDASVELPSDTHVIGAIAQMADGDASCIKHHAADGTGAFTNPSGGSTKNSSITGVRFDLAAGGGVGGWVGDLHYSTIQHCAFHFGSGGADIHVTAATGDDTLNNRFRWNHHIGNGNQNRAVRTEGNSGDDEVYGNYMEEYATEAIYLKGWTNAIHGNHIHCAGAGRAIHLDAAFTRIHDNHMGNTAADAIRVTGNTGAAEDGGAYVIITDNSFTNINKGGTANGIIEFVTDTETWDYAQVYANQARRTDGASTVSYFVHLDASSFSEVYIKDNQFESAHVTNRETNETTSKHQFNAGADFRNQSLTGIFDLWFGSGDRKLHTAGGGSDSIGVHSQDDGADIARFYEGLSMDLTAQDLSGLSLGSAEDGRIYRHDGSNSISADGGSTSAAGYYAWDNGQDEWKSLVQFG